MWWPSALARHEPRALARHEQSQLANPESRAVTGGT
jgi:hypothetical protein